MAEMFLILMAVLFAVVQTQSCGKNPIQNLKQFSNTIGNNIVTMKEHLRFNNIDLNSLIEAL